MLPGQEDEATPDPEEVPWDLHPPATGGDDSEDDENAVAVPDFDPADWLHPPKECCDGEPSNSGDGAAGSSKHGDDAGDSAVADVEANHSDDEILSPELAASIQKQSGRLQSLQDAKRIFEGIGGTLGASMTTTVKRVMRNEEKKFRQRIRGDAGVDKALRASLEADEAMAQQRRLDFQEMCEQKRQKANADQEIKQAAAKLKRVRKENRQAEAVVAAREAVKSFSPAMLGHGKKKGGTDKYQKARHEVMTRVRAIAELSLDQENDWQYFSSTWDETRAEAHGEEWGQLFAEIMQNVVNELQEGNATALSEFMRRETERILGDVGVLIIPGVS